MEAMALPNTSTDFLEKKNRGRLFPPAKEGFVPSLIHKKYGEEDLVD